MRMFSLAIALGASIPTAISAAPLIVYFDKTPEDAASTLANLCADRQANVVEQDRYHVLCTREVGGVQGALTQALIGNSYSTTPELNIRFAILPAPKGVKVQASQWVQTQMAGGQVQRMNLDNKKQTAQFQSVLTAAGATLTPPENGEQSD